MKIIMVTVFLLTACMDISSPIHIATEGKTLLVGDSLDVIWKATEACSGLHGDFHKVTYYTVSDLHVDGEYRGGVYDEPANAVIVLRNSTAKLIMHENLHAMGVRNHPGIYFRGRCGNLMEWWGI